jgi:hypothetical protein
VLDHILFSGALHARPFAFDPVHVNAEFADQASDHDPSVVRVTLNDAPTADAGGPYAVDEGDSVGLAASGNDAEGGTLTYAWDLDDNGSYETSGQTPTFSAAALDGPSTNTVGVQVTDDAGQTGTDTATVAIANVEPAATFNTPASSFAGFPFTISLTSPQDPSTADTTAGFTYAFDCGDGSGYGAFGASSSRSCPTSDIGTRAVGGKIRDQDGGVTEYTGTVQVVVTFDSLCDLVRAWSTDPKLANILCADLAAAEDADQKGKPSQVQRYLRDFKAQLDTKKARTAFTEQQIATLLRLADKL